MSTRLADHVSLRRLISPQSHAQEGNRPLHGRIGQLCCLLYCFRPASLVDSVTVNVLFNLNLEQV